MIRCREVSKSFGDFTAVDSVSLNFPRGVSALLGPNGAGKSTLLKILTGLDKPDSGEISVGGLNVLEQSPQLRKIIGVLPEDLGLFDSLTVQEHLELSGPVYGLSLEETRIRAEQLLRTLALTSGRHTFLGQCSHGMRKKTSLALAMLHNPRVVFLDEPFEGIDPVSARTIGQLLKRMGSRGITVLFTSHILSIVKEVASNIVLMRAGRIVWSNAEPDFRSLDDVYFQMIDGRPLEDLPWLRCEPS